MQDSLWLSFSSVQFYLLFNPVGIELGNRTARFQTTPMLRWARQLKQGCLSCAKSVRMENEASRRHHGLQGCLPWPFWLKFADQVREHWRCKRRCKAPASNFCMRFLKPLVVCVKRTRRNYAQAAACLICPIVLLQVARVADIAVHSAQLRITEIRQFLQIARRKDHVPFGFSGYMVAGMFDQDARSVKIKKNGSQTKFKIRCSALASFEQMPTTSVI